VRGRGVRVARDGLARLALLPLACHETLGHFFPRGARAVVHIARDAYLPPSWDVAVLRNGQDLVANLAQILKSQCRSVPCSTKSNEESTFENLHIPSKPCAQ